ncbi:hypothetical protein C5167_002611 [Papaver somniferum]|uniref:Uncharacterized protein n=1 Tax=Papaver somniferum TaxID=3469 RepID=A0A4Y7L2D1_PAPSO|nr:hypothetical protein C5167_002611 [Papaver somniferum]
MTKRLADREDKELNIAVSLVCVVCFGIPNQFTVSLNGWILLGKRSLPNSNSQSREFDYKAFILLSNR